MNTSFWQHHESIITIETQCTVLLSQKEMKLLKKWQKAMAETGAEFLLNSHKTKTQQITLSLLICGNTRIKTLNSNLRGKNRPTDVLSFPSFEASEVKSLLKNTENLHLGDMAISWDKVKIQAQNFKITNLEEFTQLFFHGFLHLLGHDHELSNKHAQLMQRLEKELFTSFSHKIAKS